MNLRDLQYIVAVANSKNFSQAAKICHISQPTLSSQIKKLEDRLGVQIFERSLKHVMPTEVGLEIIHSATRVLREVDTMHEIAKSSSDPFAGRFRLGAFPTLSTYIFPTIVPIIKDQLPKIKLILVEEKTNILIDKLKQGELDAALLALPVSDGYLTEQKLFEDEFLVATPANHPLTELTYVEPTAFETYPPLLLDEGHCLRDQALDICQQVGANEEEEFRATSLETLRQMVRAGNGITLIPRIAIQQQEDGICYLPFSSPAPKRTIGLVWRKTSGRKQVISTLTSIISSHYAQN